MTPAHDPREHREPGPPATLPRKSADSQHVPPGFWAWIRRQPLFWLALVAFVGGVSGLFVLTAGEGPFAAWVTPRYPALGLVPSFDLTDQEGRPFSSQSLKGKVWVANFMFTRCPTVCPVFTAKLAEVQRRAAAMDLDVRFVSLSVDPEFDQPEQLRAFAQRHGADLATWAFVTGSFDVLKRIIVEGFRVAMGRDAADESVEGIWHGTQWIIVDRAGLIRSYLNAAEPDAVEQALATLRALAANPS